MAQPGRSQARTKVEETYLSIKNDIVTGHLSPGQQLNLTEVGKARNVSLSVVREAVIRLASERLLQATPQQGFRVWPLSVSDLLDLTRVRIEFETLTVRESISLGGVDWEADLVAAHHRLTAAAKIVDRDSPFPTCAWVQAHSAFHAALASACTSPLLKQLRQQFFDSAEIYRYWASVLDRPRTRSVGDEHRELLEAALEHNAEAGVAKLVNHIQLTTDSILAGLESGQTSA